MERVIALIDMDAFFASIEQRDNPCLRGKPVLIAGSHAQKGIVSTCSYEARKFGIRSGMATIDARKRCPNGYYVSGNHAKYCYASSRIIEICYRFTPIVEPFSVDEMFLDISGSLKLFGSKKAIGDGIRSGIRSLLNLPSSVGIAPNKLLAKLASRFAKPDGTFVIEKEDVSGLLENLPVKDLFGVGPKTTEKLNLLGIHTAGELSRFPQHILEHKFGKGGVDLILKAKGIDNSRVDTVEDSDDPKSISNETTLYEPTDNRYHLKKILLALVHKVSFRMRKHGAKARTIRLRIRNENFETHQYHHTVGREIFFDTELYEEIIHLFDSVRFEPHKVRLIGVGVTKLTYEKHPDQLEIFPRYDVKKQLTAETIDNLKKRFGTEIINIGDSRTGDSFSFRKNNDRALSFGMKNYVKEQKGDKK